MSTTISLDSNIFKRVFPKYPESRACNSCKVVNPGWYLEERQNKTPHAANLKCCQCGAVNGYASQPKWEAVKLYVNRKGEAA